MKRLTRNALRCLACDKVIESEYRHDYKTCGCPNRAMVDGGLAYQRYGAVDMGLIENLAEYGENVEEPSCNCPRFSDTGGYRIADLTCPTHGVGGTDPGDGMWTDTTPENVEEP